MDRIAIKNGDAQIVAELWNGVRKRPVLCIQRGNESVKYASFNNEISAIEFMDELADFVGAKEQE